MLRKFSAQLFDAPAEIVIAHARVVLVALSLAAITIDPTRPARFVPIVGMMLQLYAVYALALLAALHWRVIPHLNGVLAHGIDLVVLGLLLVLTEGLSSPFLVFFTFALLAASLRWDWPGIAFTMAALVALAVAAMALDLVGDGRIANLNQTIIRAAYLVITGTILAYASAHREHERGRLARLAHWPAAATGIAQVDALHETLRRAASVLEARGALVVWDGGCGHRAALWREGEYRLFGGSRHPQVSVPPDLEGEVFSRVLPYLDRINLSDRSVRVIPDVLGGDQLPAMHILDFVTAPIRGLAAQGRLFILGNIRASDDHLPIASVVADRVGAELDRQIFLERATADAALRERSTIMRDLHDGLLQNLTAARMQLELVPADGEQAKARLRTAGELLRLEQQRVREFVDAADAADGETTPLVSLRPLLEDTGRLWGVTVAVLISPETAAVQRRILNQLSLMLAEAIANAARHGDAAGVRVTLAQREGRLEIEVLDDGRGFVGRAVANGQAQLGEAELPRSLKERVRDLGGQMHAWTSTSGSVLRVELPL